MRKLITLLFLGLMCPLGLYSQTIGHVKTPEPGEITIDNVQVAVGPVLTISYTIRLGEGVKWCKTGLYLSTDGGSTYTRVSESKYLSGDVGKITISGDKEIKFDITEIKQELADKQLDFKVKVIGKDVIKREYLIAGTASVYPNMSYGLMIGTVRKSGAYIKARTNFNTISPSYNCNINGEMENGGVIWSDGVESRSRFIITGGMMFHAMPWLYPYIGAGYGSKQLYLQDTEKQWATVTDYSYKGLSIDAGLLFKFNKIVVSTAVCNTAFKYTEGEIGIGFIF